MRMEAAVMKPRPANRLARVVSGKLARPIRAVLYSTEGLGKSTFASHAPSPIFVGAEDGTAHLAVHRMPDIASWRDIQEALAELEESEHEFSTVVIDTVDWVEPMIWEALCKAEGKKNIEEFGYGKGYIAALTEWRKLCLALDRLREKRRMHSIVLAHAQIRTFKNPEGDDFDRYEMKLHHKASGVLKEWSDVVLFANHETLTHKAKNERAKGVSTGARIIHTERTAAWDAKNRYDLPTQLPLDWEAFFDAVAAHRPQDPETLRRRIASMLENADDKLRARVALSVAKAAEDAAELARIADKLTAMVAIKAKESET